MVHLIDKDALVAEIERRIESCAKQREDMLNAQCHTLADDASARMGELRCFQDFLNTLEVEDPYEQCVQYPSVKDGIQAHAETYSFNIKSLLFNQLTKEQQKLWRKEIEQACISGGEAGVELARDIRYKENLEAKEVDLDDYYHKFLDKEWFNATHVRTVSEMMAFTAKHFFELGLRCTITEEDCKLIWNIGDEIPNMPEEEFFKELLKRYKAQKGEEG